MPTFRLRLAKADFKFAAAHFTLFAEREAEALHGHNYRVAVDVEGEELDGAGLLVEIGPLKQRIRELCSSWDERILIPGGSAEIASQRTGDEVTVRYRSRRYVFPADEVVELPLVNTTIELLARHLWSGLAPAVAGVATRLAVSVEDTEGQSCRYSAAL